MGELMSQKTDVVIPTIGESISEGTIGRWFYKEGDIVRKDQPLLEVDSDKATLEVTAAASGKLKIIVPAGKTASVGALVGVIEASDEVAAVNPKPAAGPAPILPKAETAAVSKATSSAPATPSPTASTPAANGSSSKNVVSMDLKAFGPAKRKAIREGNFQPANQAGVQLFVDESTREIHKPMSTLRKRIAERLLESQQTTATLTTFNEIDMSKAMEIRKKLKDSFEKTHGVKLGFMSFFAKAVVHALQAYPDVNARIQGDDIVYPQFVNLGVAVSTERGLVVPVIKDAQNLSYSQLEKNIGDVAERARSGKLQIPEMQGGTFTLTNGGVFGSLLSTPIINPPQSGILGMHKIEQRPMAIEKNGAYSVEVRPMMYVALSYDHRIIDGATSVGFLVKVKEYMETVTESAVS